MPSATKVGIHIWCARCDRVKCPRGRDPGLSNGYCTRECDGYDADPQVGSLWPNETDADFGYPCSDVGTKPVSP